MIRAIIILLAIVYATNISAQNILDLQPADTIPFDPEVRTGILPNGFTFYIRNNKSDPGKADLYFVVKAGTNHQEADQIELAHVLEHLAFGGTKNFPNANIYFREQRITINGFTSGMYTLYLLKEIPTTDRNLLKKGILFFHDISHNMLLDSADIERQRNVVWNELKNANGFHFLFQSMYINQVISNPGFTFPSRDEHFKNLKEFKHSFITQIL